MCAVYFRIEWEFALRCPLRAKPIVIVALALALVTSPAVAAQIAWNDTSDVKGCDGNWYRIERPHSMRQCLENGSAFARQRKRNKDAGATSVRSRMAEAGNRDVIEQENPVPNAASLLISQS